MIATAQIVIFLALHVLVLGFCVVAVVDAARRPAAAFTAAGKRTKNFWLAVTGVATAVAFVGLPPPLGLGLFGFLVIVAAVAGIVYLVDVRPAVSSYGGGRGGRARGSW